MISATVIDCNFTKLGDAVKRGLTSMMIERVSSSIPNKWFKPLKPGPFLEEQQRSMVESSRLNYRKQAGMEDNMVIKYASSLFKAKAVHWWLGRRTEELHTDVRPMERVLICCQERGLAG